MNKKGNKNQRKAQKVTAFKKNALTNELLDKWKNTATSIFQLKCDELDDFISDEIERKLYEFGSVVFFRDEDDGVYKVLPWSLFGGLNIYGLPMAWYVRGVNGFHKLLNYENSILIWNNKTRRPTRNYVELMIDRLVNIELTIDTNLNALKVPFIFSGEKDQLLTFQNLYKQISENDPVVYVEESIGDKSLFSVANSNTPNHTESLMKLYNDTEGRILNYIGLKYTGVEKKERLITDEVNANNEHTNTNFGSMWKARQNAVNRMKELYGLNAEYILNPSLQEFNEDNEKVTSDIDKKEGK